jgi:hypothetical protein
MLGIADRLRRGGTRVSTLLGLVRIVTFVLLLIRFIPESLTHSVPLFLKRECDRTLGAARATSRALPSNSQKAGRQGGGRGQPQ